MTIYWGGGGTPSSNQYYWKCTQNEIWQVNWQIQGTPDNNTHYTRLYRRYLTDAEYGQWQAGNEAGLPAWFKFYTNIPPNEIGKRYEVINWFSPSTIDGTTSVVWVLIKVEIVRRMTPGNLVDMGSSDTVVSSETMPVGLRVLRKACSKTPPA